MLVIRKLDNHNFTLATKLKEPKVVKIKDKEVIYHYKNENLYYGNLFGAITGFCKHNNIEAFKIPDELKKIKPYSDEVLYMPFCDVGIEEIKQIIENEYLTKAKS